MSSPLPPAIYCYSKTGTTLRVVEALAQSTGAEIIPITVDRYRVPLFWICRAIWDVGQANVPPLSTGHVTPEDRPWIVVAGPIWADQLAPPGRSVLQMLAQTDLRVGVLTTCGRASAQTKYIDTCEAVLGRRLTAHLSVQGKTVGTQDMTRKLAQFADALGPRRVTGVA